MKRMIEAREEPVEQLLAELDVCLMEIRDNQLPDIGARLQDVQRYCNAAQCILDKLEGQLIYQKR